ncbi:hypothetical protein [Streptomyces melanogenes]|uniref:hypothetical protein n=1 Tax=Streptomyces melanogenes TaxID=67326 RepID=UPI00167D91B8|nr:hypothetical protein [Streptomyces melanogenes]GGP72035.1 hypothetical protein GCM10010278_57590 [Streptomyces melanogenes]
MNAAVRDPLTYLSNPPRLICRGVASGQKVPRGQQLYVRWTPPNSSDSSFPTDAGAQWFTVPDSGIYLVSASVTVDSIGSTQVDGDGVVLFLTKRATPGTQTSMAIVREIYQRPGIPQLYSVQTLAYLQAGESIGVALYLDSGSPSDAYRLTAGSEAQHSISAHMVGAAATLQSGPTNPPITIPSWADSEVLAPSDLASRITTPLQVLYSPPAFLVQSVLDYSYTASAGQRRSIPWRGSAFEQAGGWILGAGGTTLTAPRSGVYLISYFTAVERAGTSGTAGSSFQIYLVRNGVPIAVHHRQHTRTGMWASGIGSELVFLKAGDALSVELSAATAGTTWRNPTQDSGTNEVWHSFSGVLLAPSATSMQG